MIDCNFYCDGIEITSGLKLNDISFEHDNLPEYITNINCPLSANEEISFECDANPQLYEKLMGVDLGQCNDLTSFTIEFKTSRQVQIRRHKKKRINKKWAKQYGYKTMFKTVRMTDAKFESKTDGDIEISGKLAHDI